MLLLSGIFNTNSGYRPMPVGSLPLHAPDAPSPFTVKTNVPNPLSALQAPRGLGSSNSNEKGRTESGHERERLNTDRLERERLDKDRLEKDCLERESSAKEKERKRREANKVKAQRDAVDAARK